MKEVFSIDKTMGREVRFQLDYVTNDPSNVVDKFLLYGPGCNDDNDSTACAAPDEFPIGEPEAFFEFEQTLLAVSILRTLLLILSGLLTIFPYLLFSRGSTALPW